MINEMHDYCKPAGTRRLRFRDWLKQKLDDNEVEGVEWIDRSRGLFKIPWKHGLHRQWCCHYDSEIFKQWAIYSGKYTEGIDLPNPSKWKTNFRCTLNALPDFKEVREKSRPRGNEAYKIYMMKSKHSKTERKATGEKRKSLENYKPLYIPQIFIKIENHTALVRKCKFHNKVRTLEGSHQKRMTTRHDTNVSSHSVLILVI